MSYKRGGQMATVSTALTKIAGFKLGENPDAHIDEAMFTIVNGATTLNAFQVRFRVNPDGPEVTVMSAAANFASTDERFKGVVIVNGSNSIQAATDLTTLTNAYSALLSFNTKSLAEISFYASVAASTSDMQAYMGGSSGD